MRRVARFCVTAGIAVAGASLFAIAPLSPSLPDVEVPAVQLSNDTAPQTRDFMDLWQIATGETINLNVDETYPEAGFGDLLGGLEGTEVVVPSQTMWQDILDKSTPDLKSEIQTDPTSILQAGQ